MEYPKPAVTVDIIIFTVKDDELKVLLVKRGIEPFKNMWAIPGGFIHMNETLDEAAKRELFEETGVRDIYLEQLYTFGDVERDPRERVITVSYFALVKSDKVNLKASTDVIEVDWFSMWKLPKLAFDHKKILEYSLKRLRWKLEYTSVAFQLLPKEFTLSELQQIYEIVFARAFDKRNFRKKLFSLDIVEETGRMQEGVPNRPAMLYRFKGKIGQIVEIV